MNVGTTGFKDFSLSLVALGKLHCIASRMRNFVFQPFYKLLAKTRVHNSSTLEQKEFLIKLETIKIGLYVVYSSLKSIVNKWIKITP